MELDHLWDLVSSKFNVVIPTVVEFLGWGENAKCVVTASFRRTIFSVLLKKDFYSLKNYMQDRAEQFLRSIGLEDRLVAYDIRCACPA